MSVFLRDSLKSAASLRNAAVAVKPNTEKVSKWLNTLNQRAQSGESKAACAQLSSLFNFYSKPTSQDPLPAIDWEYYRKTIKTEGLVDKVQKNYEQLVSQEYNVEQVCNAVVQSQSKELEELESELTFHSAVWAHYYAQQTLSLYELEDVGELTDLLFHEYFDTFPGHEAMAEELIETHNWFPGSKSDINIRQYFHTQFNWGKKVISFFRHPADDFKAGRCTKNILGR